MKTLGQIKDEYARTLDNGTFRDWEHYRKYNDIEEEDLEKISKLFSIEVAKQSLNNIATYIEDNCDFVEKLEIKSVIVAKENIPL